MAQPAQPRPPLVQAAGIMLIVGGALGVLAALLLFGASGVIPAAALFAILSLVLGAGEIYAGTQVLALKEQGRMIGLILAGIGAALSLIQVILGYPSSILGLLINGFIVYALVTNAQHFRRA